MEIDSNNSTNRLKLQQKVKGYQGDLQRVKRELNSASSAVSQSMMRSDLMAGGQSQDYQVSTNPAVRIVTQATIGSIHGSKATIFGRNRKTN